MSSFTKNQSGYVAALAVALPWSMYLIIGYSLYMLPYRSAAAAGWENALSNVDWAYWALPNSLLIPFAAVTKNIWIGYLLLGLSNIAFSLGLIRFRGCLFRNGIRAVLYVIAYVVVSSAMVFLSVYSGLWAAFGR